MSISCFACKLFPSLRSYRRLMERGAFRTSGIIAGIAILGSLLFFASDSQREGKITFKAPGGTEFSMDVKGKISIAELLSSGLNDPKTSDATAYAIKEVIRQRPLPDPLAKAVIGLASQPDTPFQFKPLRVSLEFDKDVREKAAGLCDDSSLKQFSGINLFIYTKKRSGPEDSINLAVIPADVEPCLPSNESAVRPTNASEAIRIGDPKLKKYTDRSDIIVVAKPDF